jgi:hypothetical protein
LSGYLFFFLAIIGLCFGVLLTHPTLGRATTLSDLAASMQPGQWAELTPNNINPTLTNTGGASAFIFGYTDSTKGDPVSRQFFFIGMDHNQPSGERFVSYTESTNSTLAANTSTFICSWAK